MNLNDCYKYPRTYHFPFSPGLQNDDRVITTLEYLEGKEVVVTEKRDGENTNIYPNYFHPRSLIDDGHPSRSVVKGIAASVQWMMPASMRICAENLYAEHSIRYEHLESYLEVFGIWMGGCCIPWVMTENFCNTMGLKTVPVLWKGLFDYSKVQSIFESLDFSCQEGIVCRVAEAFTYEDFATHCAKAVRAGHVQTDEHWTKNWKPNGLRK